MNDEEAVVGFGHHRVVQKRQHRQRLRGGQCFNVGKLLFLECCEIGENNMYWLSGNMTVRALNYPTDMFTDTGSILSCTSHIKLFVTHILTHFLRSTAVH